MGARAPKLDGPELSILNWEMLGVIYDIRWSKYA